MFLIFGTRVTTKVLGQTKVYECGRCHNRGPWNIIKVTNWLALYFIPMIPLQTQYFEECPVCHGKTLINKEEAERLISGREVL